MKDWKDIQYLYDHHDGIEVFSATDSRLKYPPHSHTSHLVIGMITKGSVLLYQNRIAHIYQAGQCFFVFPYEEHSIEPMDLYSMVCICINQNPESLRKADEIESITRRTLKYLKEEFPSMSRVEDSFPDSYNHLAAASSFEKNGADPLLIRVMKQIENHPEVDLSIDILAHKACMNKYYFIKRFQQLSGLPPHQFQIQCRLRKAQHQLAQSGRETTITDIALNTGFCDQSHFTKQFRKYTGLNPGYYLSHCYCMDLLS